MNQLNHCPFSTFQQNWTGRGGRAVTKLLMWMVTILCRQITGEHLEEVLAALFQGFQVFWVETLCWAIGFWYFEGLTQLGMPGTSPPVTSMTFQKTWTHNQRTVWQQTIESVSCDLKFEVFTVVYVKMLCSRMWSPVLWYCWYLSGNMYGATCQKAALLILIACTVYDLSVRLLYRSFE